MGAMAPARNPATLAAVALLVVLGAALYSTNLSNPLFWDDEDIVVLNEDVHGLGPQNLRRMFTRDLMAGSGTRTNYYRPLTSLSFAANYAVGGLDPRGYHAVNDALHVAAAVLVFLLLASATASRPAALIAAVLFLVHPLQTEAVTYVAGRSDPLHLVFVLAALGAFWIAERRGVGWNGWPRPLSLVLFVAALASHERAIVLPFLLAVFAAAFAAGGAGFVGTLRLGLQRSIPYFGVAAAYFICRLTFLNFVNTLDFHSVPSVYSQNLHVRLFTFLHALLVYYRLMLFPTGLHYKRSIAVHTSFFDLGVWTSALLLALLAALLVALWRRGPTAPAGGVEGRRIWLFGVGWLFATLGPVSGITPINALIYEHWLYVGLIGPATIAGWYLARTWDAAGRRGSDVRAVIAVCFVLYAGFLSAQTVRRNRLWGKPFEFLQDILRYEPEDIAVNNNLAGMYYDRGDMRLAEFHYKLAAAGQNISPHPHYNLGVIHDERGDTSQAIAEYERALDIDPGFAPALQALVEIHGRLGEFDEALRRIEQLKRARPDDPHVYYNSALALEHVGRREPALADARRAVELAVDPSQAEVGRRAQQLIETLQRGERSR